MFQQSVYNAPHRHGADINEVTATIIRVRAAAVGRPDSANAANTDGVDLVAGELVLILPVGDHPDTGIWTVGADPTKPLRPIPANGFVVRVPRRGRSESWAHAWEPGGAVFRGRGGKNEHRTIKTSPRHTQNDLAEGNPDAGGRGGRYAWRVDVRYERMRLAHPTHGTETMVITDSTPRWRRGMGAKSTG